MFGKSGLGYLATLNVETYFQFITILAKHKNDFYRNKMSSVHFENAKNFARIHHCKEICIAGIAHQINFYLTFYITFKNHAFNFNLHEQIKTKVVVFKSKGISYLPLIAIVPLRDSSSTILLNLH